MDDDPDLQTILGLRFKEHNIDVMHSYFGMQGVTTAIESKPDLILLDVAMPNGDGCYFLECIRENDETARIPVIVLSGMRDRKIKERILCAGADLFLSKPVCFDELLHQMSRFVELKFSPV